MRIAIFAQKTASKTTVLYKRIPLIKAEDGQIRATGQQGNRATGQQGNRATGQQATGNRQQATGNRQQATGNRQQATGNSISTR